MEKIMICLILVFSFVSGKYVTVEQAQTYISIKSDETYSQSAFPGLHLNNVRVKQLQNKTYHYSTICSVRPSSIVSRPISLLGLSNFNNSLSIISSIQQIKTLSKPIIDMIMFQDHFYSVFMNNSISIHKIEQTSNNNILKLINSIELNKVSNNGYLVKNDQTLLFVSKEECLFLNTTGSIKINGYKEQTHLNYVRLFEDELFISTNQQIIYYHFNSTTLELSAHSIINISQILKTKIQIEDFYYEKQKQKLVVLDYLTGAYFFDVSLNGQKLYPQQNTQHFINRTKCQNIVFNNEVVYLTCPELIRYNITNFEQKTKQIRLFANDLLLNSDQIIIVGESYIQLFQNWETTSLLLKIEGPKFIIHTNKLAYINKEGIKFEKFDLQQETLICSAEHHEIGLHEIVLYGEGKCNQGYLKQNNINIEIAYYDTCNYEKTILVQVWEPHIIKWIFASIGTISLVIVLIIFFIWCCVRSMLLKKQYNVLVETNAAENEMNPKSQVQPSVDIDITGRQIS